MIKVITYGTFDLLHHGHLRLLERAKALGDYLIVGVTSDDFDRMRGKINTHQTLMERVAGVRETGLADEIIVEEYEGQKIDDIKKMGIDIFTVGSDWTGQFDYLNEFCKVVYLPRTMGISSSGVRSESRRLRIGLLGDTKYYSKFFRESLFVNGIVVIGIFPGVQESECPNLYNAESYDDLLERVDAVYIFSKPEDHYKDAKKALEAGKHVLCEAPVSCSSEEAKQLYNLAAEKDLILMDAVKTAYSTAYERLILMTKSGTIGNIVSVDSTCTSLRDGITADGADLSKKWNSMCAWGPCAILPVFDIFGTDYSSLRFCTKFLDKKENMDSFTRMDLIYPSGVATVKVAKGAKSEGELIITGTKGYIYVPAPWWKTDYFEVRYENPEDNRRFFYQLDGEGIRYEIAAFAKAVESGKNISCISKETSVSIAGLIEKFNNRDDMVELQ